MYKRRGPKCDRGVGLHCRGTRLRGHAATGPCWWSGAALAVDAARAAVQRVVDEEVTLHTEDAVAGGAAEHLRTHTGMGDRAPDLPGHPRRRPLLKYSHFCPSASPDKPGRTCSNSRSWSVKTPDSRSLLDTRRPSVLFKGPKPPGGSLTCPFQDPLQGSLERPEGGRGGERTWPGGGPTPESSLQKRPHGTGSRRTRRLWAPLWSQLLPLTAHFTLHGQLRVLGVTLWTEVPPQGQVWTAAASVQVPARHT